LVDLEKAKLPESQTMPYLICPDCNRGFHLSVHLPVDEWMRRYVKERTVEGVPMLRCFDCSKKAGEFDSVEPKPP
jgi:hypothetical protein